MTKLITQKPAIVISHLPLPPMDIDVITSNEFEQEQKTYNLECEKLEKLYRAAPLMLDQLKSLLFVTESLAHLRGMERELMPTCNGIRAFIEDLEK